MRLLALFAATLCLSGCFTIGDSARPIATETVPARTLAAERPLVVVLPGFGSDVDDLRQRGIAGAIQDAWPEADVLLTSATFAYYRDGRLVPRLHDEVIEPARRQGYKRIWLAGASMGGMGALLYEREHPGAVAGAVLFAPFLGDASLLREIRAAGGPRQWEPGPLPAEMNGDNYQRQVWRMVKGWGERPELARRVWLACGTSDHLIDAARLLAPEVGAGRFHEFDGGHTWQAWIAAARTVFTRIRMEEART